MLRYHTAAKDAIAEIVVEKSRFIAHVRPVLSREEADRFLAEVRAKHKSATHHVPALLLGEKRELQWASDDGEPQGTSGVPMLQMLAKEDLTNLMVVVTRYFGGVKLGTGGLSRAYTGAAKAALDASGIAAVHDLLVLAVSLEYSFLGKLQNDAVLQGFEVLEINYEDRVFLKLAIEPERQESLQSYLANLTAGQYEQGESQIQLVKKIRNGC